MARRGRFGSNGAPLTDLSVYQIGPAPAAAPLPKPPAAAPQYAAAEAPVKPTVAPENGVLPSPVIPKVAIPSIYLNPDTSAAREAIRARALAAGKTPTTAEINATYAKNKARLLAGA